MAPLLNAIQNYIKSKKWTSLGQQNFNQLLHSVIWCFSFYVCWQSQHTQILGVIPCVYVLSCFSHVQLMPQYAMQPARLLCPWDSPGKNIEVCCYALLQGIFLTQGLNRHLLHLPCIGRQVLHQCHLYLLNSKSLLIFYV